MAVPKAQWIKMSWPERIAEILASHKLSQKDLANRLRVTHQTICNWVSGQNAPCCKHALFLSRLGIADTFADMKDASYFMLHSASADAASVISSQAMLSGDPMVLAMVLHCIAMKQAALIATHCSNPSIVIRSKAVFGDNATTLTIENANAQDTREVRIIVSVPEDAVQMQNCVLTATFSQNGVDKSKLAYTTSDKALARLTKATIAFLK